MSDDPYLDRNMQLLNKNVIVLDWLFNIVLDFFLKTKREEFV
jgi:hypothetical protein